MSTKGGMVKTNELKGKIITVFGKQYLFARAVRATESKVSRAISGVNKLEPSEAREWEKALGLDIGELRQLEV